jgi:hypothetical protein
MNMSGAALLALLASAPTLWAAVAGGDVPISQGLIRFLIAYVLARFALGRLAWLFVSYSRDAGRADRRPERREGDPETSARQD